MAVYRYLAIDCGDSAAADAMAAGFSDLPLVLEDGLRTRCGVMTRRDGEGRSWCLVRPFGASSNAAWLDGSREPLLASVEQCVSLGAALYAQLRTAPPFARALYGAEAFEAFFDVEDMHDLFVGELGLFDAGWEGLVLHRALHASLGSPGGFVPFREDAVWRPYPCG